MEYRIEQITLEKFLKEDPNNTITRHMAAIASKVRDRAKEKAPVAQADEDAKPGALRDSLKSVPDPEHFGSYLVGSALPYAAYVEFGTVDSHPQPYLRPALDEVMTEVERG